ncbi:MAG TPA: alpha/beta hydrolase [Candidatus Saccharimonadales bacterium]|nr:alpha/beta hydrolase [Candidatus Saccharimonadales bacterium]
MPHDAPKDIADYIAPLNINGMDGRMLRLPPPKNKSAELLFVYGHHSSLERWWGLMQVLNRYGAVTMPDLPGFGGMDSFYKIGKKPSIDNLADYLAAFIKLRYRRKKVAIAGMSFGFVIVTRMLQRYPELEKKVTLLVSIVGFAHKDDFTFSKPRYNFYLYGTHLLSLRLPAKIFRYTAVNTLVLRTFYGHTHNAKNKFAEATTKEDYKRLMDMEVSLWHDNDIRTWAYTTTQFLTFDNCKVKVNLPVWHVSAEADRYFDNHVVEQHMRIIFSDFHVAPINVKNHAPSVIADEKAAAALVPSNLRRALRTLQ